MAKLDARFVLSLQIVVHQADEGFNVERSLPQHFPDPARTLFVRFTLMLGVRILDSVHVLMAPVHEAGVENDRRALDFGAFEPVLDNFIALAVGSPKLELHTQAGASLCGCGCCGSRARMRARAVLWLWM